MLMGIRLIDKKDRVPKGLFKCYSNCTIPSIINSF